TADGTGMNANMARMGPAHCTINCSGVRENDFAQHVDPTPDTALGFVCNSCNTGGGVCGREVHCAATATTQAAWDFAARDLTAPPFNLDSQTAWLIASRIFFVGSGNVGA